MNARQMVTTLGWIWIGLGALAFMSGSGGFLMSLVMGDLPKTPPGNAFTADILFKHYRTAAAIQVFFALFVIFTGFHFLRRRNWARIAIQIFSVLTILWFVLFGVIWVRTLGQVTAAPDGPPEGMVMVMRLAMSIGGVVMMLGMAATFGLCIWTLNRASIRREFHRDIQLTQG